MRSRLVLILGCCAWLLAACPALLRAEESATADKREWQNLIAKIQPAFVSIGGGSGVCISPDGLMLTNHHVAGSLSEWKIAMPGGAGEPARQLSATLLGQDPQGDLCLLKIQSETPLPFVPLGDSEALRVGDPVIAMGNPFLLAGADAKPTITVGIVSVLHKFQNNYTDSIQTDAAINPGNSGGPLLNAAGELIGINGQVAVRFGKRYNTGAGFAIPAHQIRRFLEPMKNANGKVVPHGTILGLVLQPDSPGRDGAAITQIRDDVPAFAAGIRTHDKIVAIDGQAIASLFDFYRVIGTYPAGVEVTVGLRRDTETMNVILKLDSAAAREQLTIGIVEDTEYAGPGVHIRKCKKGGAAAEAGLMTGDILTHVNGAELQTLQDWQRLLNQCKLGDKITLAYARDGQTGTVSVEVHAETVKDRR